MVETGSITPADAAAAKAAPAQVAAPRTRAGTGYFADWVFAESRLYADADQPRLMVRTTLDQKLQRAAEEAVEAAFAQTRTAKGLSRWRWSP